MTTTYTGRHHHCLPPRQPAALLMAFCPDEASDDFPVVAPPHGLTLMVAFIHTDTGRYQGEMQRYDLLPDQKVHLFRSQFRDWFFIAKRDSYRSRYGCSCLQRFCEHVRTLIALEARS